VAVGDPVARVTSILGQPTETQDDSPGGHLLLYEADGVAYALTTDGTEVVTIHAGVPDWAKAWEGCA
jgi:hypothetical protein